MKIYTTYGTYDYLNQIRLNHPENHLFIYSTNDSSVIIEESEDKSIYLNTLLLMKLLMKSMSLIINISIQLSSFQFRRSCQSTRKRLSNLNLDFSQFAGFKSYRFYDLKKVLLIKFLLLR